MLYCSIYSSRIDSPTTTSIVLSTDHERTSKEPNGRSVVQINDRLYECPETCKHNTSDDNHVDNSCRDLVHRERSPYRHKDPGSSILLQNVSDLDKKRSQFRRSPSYTNAISIDNDTGPEGTGTPTAPAPSGMYVSVPHKNCKNEISPKRCPSYSDAVEQSPVLNGKGENLDPKAQQQTKTKYFEGKYYVGVANDIDDNTL